MKIYIVDFEMVLKNYSPYHESLDRINKEKQKFSDKIDEIKKEMESIISTSKSLFLDEANKQKSANRFKELQSEGMKLDSDFRAEIVEMQNQELENNFSDITELVKMWGNASGVDIILNKNQTIFSIDKLDATETVINILKEKDLYKEYNEEEFTISQ